MSSRANLCEPLNLKKRTKGKQGKVSSILICLAMFNRKKGKFCPYLPYHASNNNNKYPIKWCKHTQKHKGAP